MSLNRIRSSRYNPHRLLFGGVSLCCQFVADEQVSIKVFPDWFLDVDVDYHVLSGSVSLPPAPLDLEELRNNGGAFLDRLTSATEGAGGCQSAPR